MTDLFLRILNMSISASYIVIALLLLRFPLKKAPKWICVLLWGIVAVRLICPISAESILSLIPSAETVNPNIMTDSFQGVNTGIPELNSAIEPIIKELAMPQQNGKSALQLLIPILSAVWISGCFALLLYTFVSYMKVRRKIGTAVLLRDNIYQSEAVVSPFVLGLIKPQIYLPFSISEKDMEHVIAHEKAHIYRKDHLWKPLGFILLTAHWFNPLMWLGYILLCRDIELACDEKVIKNLDRNAIADYSEALLTCSVNRRMIAACPLAFGETSVKSRVRTVLNYKKPAFWIIIAAILTSIIVAVCFLTDPVDSKNIGVKSVSAKSTGHDTIELKIKYSMYSYGKYYVRSVPEDEDEQGSNGNVDYDGALGKYRIMIGFGDTGTSDELAQNLLKEDVIELDNTKIKIRTKLTKPSDHGFVLYLGFDIPVSVDNIESGKLSQLGGTITIPIKVLKNKLIYSFVPEESAENTPKHIYVSDYGCDEKDINITFKNARVENGQIKFDIIWKNNSSDNHTVGPDFEVYKYFGSSQVKLNKKGVWTLNILLLSGDFPGFDNEMELSYNLSAHYGPLSSGRYRFEAHGAWVEFQIIGSFSYTSYIHDSAIFDVDGDGIDEICIMRPGYTSGLFSFVFQVQDKEFGIIKYETIFHSDPYNLSFQKCSDGITRVKAVSNETHLFDISVSHGNISLTENGVPIGFLQFEHLM